jgi:Uncharacterized protein conserved in bacteria (DUF2332)
VRGTADEMRWLEQFFRIFAATQCHGRSLVYERLSEGIAGDDDALDLLLRTPEEQRRPSLLLAAVNLLLASHPDSALAAYYPTHGGLRPADAQLFPAAGRRPVAWVFAEAPGLAAAMNLTAPALTGPLARRNSLYLVGASLRGPGNSRDDSLLALADPYLRWLAPARGSTDDFEWVR